MVLNCDEVISRGRVVMNSRSEQSIENAKTTVLMRPHGFSSNGINSSVPSTIIYAYFHSCNWALLHASITNYLMDFSAKTRQPQLITLTDISHSERVELVLLPPLFPCLMVEMSTHTTRSTTTKLGRRVSDVAIWTGDRLSFYFKFLVAFGLDSQF